MYTALDHLDQSETRVEAAEVPRDEERWDGSFLLRVRRMRPSGEAVETFAKAASYQAAAGMLSGLSQIWR